MEMAMSRDHECIDTGDRWKWDGVRVTPMLAALARQEIAIERVVILAENTRSRRTPLSDIMGKAGDDRSDSLSLAQRLYFER
jgi:hypothetical protein